MTKSSSKQDGAITSRIGSGTSNLRGGMSRRGVNDANEGNLTSRSILQQPLMSSRIHSNTYRPSLKSEGKTGEVN
jgi:hypothetical protein